MTATLRTTKYMRYTLPDGIAGKETNINEYFKTVEAQHWQLKHYLNYRLKNERVILPWVQIYEDWLHSLKSIRKTNHKGIPGCVSSLCNELLNVTNSFEGASVLESCIQWYNKFYERNFDLLFAERVRQLETDILHYNFSSQKMAELTNGSGEVNSELSKVGDRRNE
jgi:hypothetical protein